MALNVDCLQFASSDTSAVEPSEVIVDVLIGTQAIGGGWKRAIDLTLGLALLIFFAPLFLLLAAVIKLSDGGPVFFSHRRIGFGGVPFGCLKFRTMRQDASDRLAAYLEANPAADAEWRAAQKLRSDPRTTFVGAVLRKSSLDELPQLINVVSGDMSLVGPRPVTAEELPRYGACLPSYLSARPGLTGLWQISGRSDVSYDRRVAFDVDYVSGWSLKNDLTILGKTVPLLLLQRGSY